MPKIRMRLLATIASLMLPFFLVYVLRTAAASIMNNCSVPGDFSTIQAAVDNPECETINVGGGTFIEQVVITRTVSIVGRGADATIVQGGAGFRAFQIRSGGIVTLRGMTISGGSAVFGGGLLNDPGGIVIINECVISGNSSTYSGGGIANRSVMTISNSTLSGNVATGSGGAILLHGSPGIVRNSTLAENTSGAGNSVYLYDNSALTVTNSILSSNAIGDDCSGEGAIISAGYNLDSDGSCNLTAAGDLPATNPHLGPLADHGGATFTHAFLPGSPALDAGYCPGVAVDQRGFLRPVDMPNIVNVADGCDIGAFETAEIEEILIYLPVVTR